MFEFELEMRSCWCLCSRSSCCVLVGDCVLGVVFEMVFYFLLPYLVIV